MRRSVRTTGAQHVALKSEFVTVRTELLGRHDAPGIVDQRVDAVESFAQCVSELSHRREVIKVADERNSVHHAGDFSCPLRVSPDDRDSPGPSRQLPGDFGSNSATGAGYYCGSVHGTLSLVTPAYGLGII